MAEDIDATLIATGDDATASSSPPRESGPPSPGTLIGRYVVLSSLGAGGMGVVWSAYDPELDRKVALKLLARLADDRTEQARERLRREAQALAKLAHPNVVGVYDVDLHEGQLYVAMEFVAGRTLGSWMREKEPRPWRAVLEIFMAAGRGLAAAHAAGLVHRDFKPDNAMIGDDGRVRVMDFGLARATGDEGDGESTLSASPVSTTGDEAGDGNARRDHGLSAEQGQADLRRLSQDLGQLRHVLALETGAAQGRAGQTLELTGSGSAGRRRQHHARARCRAGARDRIDGRGDARQDLGHLREHGQGLGEEVGHGLAELGCVLALEPGVLDRGLAEALEGRL
ncbi:MAG: serine/threonine protein kinase, partial [Myxococcales bacterium]|nr:serine/threonine protein kinase [Myxococcales bacterium]